MMKRIPFPKEIAEFAKEERIYLTSHSSFASEEERGAGDIL